MQNRVSRNSGLRWAILAFILAPAALSSQSLTAESWTDRLASALDKAASNYWNPSVLVVLGTFTYAHDELASPFSRWLTDNLHSVIPRTKSLRLFDKDVAAAMDFDGLVSRQRNR